MLESFDTFFGPLRKRFDSAVIQVPDVAVHLMPGCGPLGKIPEPDTLNRAPDVELSRDNHSKRNVQGSLFKVELIDLEE